MLQNTGTTTHIAGKVWTTTETGAEWKPQTATSGGGISSESADLLCDILEEALYGSNTIPSISILRTLLKESASQGGGNVNPPESTEAILESITVTYSGGDVLEGTPLNNLTDVRVIGSYSDGTFILISGYTLSGTISEGENIITVSFGGKTAQFIVNGIGKSKNIFNPSMAVVDKRLDTSGNLIDGSGYMFCIIPAIYNHTIKGLIKNNTSISEPGTTITVQNNITFARSIKTEPVGNTIDEIIANTQTITDGWNNTVGNVSPFYANNSKGITCTSEDADYMFISFRSYDDTPLENIMLYDYTEHGAITQFEEFGGWD